jgi:hypothetical protein
MIRSMLVRNPGLASRYQRAVRRAGALAAGAVMALSLGVPARASAAPDGSVGICHRTSSAAKPFVFITVAAGSASVHLAHGDRIASDPADCKLSLHYVTDSLKVGSTPSEASANAIDLDGDGFPDNVLGAFLSVISSLFGFDAQIAGSLESGDVVILHSLHTDSLKKDHAASWQVHLGHPQPDPVLTGGGTFVIDSAAPTSDTLSGPLDRGRFAGGPGVIALRLGLVSGQPPVEVHLGAGRIQAACDADSCAGELGGGVTTSEVDAVIIPAMAAAMQAVIDADPSCAPPAPGPCTGPAGTIVAIFDANGDHTITAEELKANSLINAILTPDLDLLDADGRPGQDGVRESLSLGLGFTARNAIFDEGGP